MHSVKAITTSLRFLKSSKSLATRNQVSHFSSSSFSLPLLNRSHDLLRFHKNYQKHNFSSKPNLILERVYTNDWSEELEKDLEECRESLTHETVVYVLKRLDKNPIKVFTFFNWVSEKDWFMSSSSVYSLVLRVLASNKKMKEFWIVLRAMKEKGFYLDEETHLTISTGLKNEKMSSYVVALKNFYKGMIEQNAMQSVVKKVVNIISGSDWGDKVENALEKVKIQLSDNFVIRVVKELQNSPLKAYKFFHWVGKQSGYKQNTVTYNAVARVLPRMESIEEFWSILEEMKSVGHELDLDTYIKISRQLQKNKMTEDAVKLYEHMMDSSYKPSVPDCIMLLKSISASDKPNLDLVFRVAKKFESTGYTLSKAVYDGIHRSLIGAGKFDEAEKIVETMKNAGYEPDNITYSQLIFGLCKTGRFEEALKVIDDMQAINLWVYHKTWTILIQGYCDAGELDGALLNLYKMMEKSSGPDAELLEVLVDGFLEQKRIDDAYKLLLEIAGKGHLNPSPWQATFEKLIDGLLGVRKFEEALDILRLMKSKQYPPYHEPFASYISKFGTMEDAAEFLRALSMKNYPSHTVYLQIFKSLFQEGRLSEAKDLLYKCPHHIRKHRKICELFGSSNSQTTETQLVTA